jgi:RHS repeat-associated protein
MREVHAFGGDGQHLRVVRKGGEKMTRTVTIQADMSMTCRSYYRARYYDSSNGRFISEDPILSGLNFYAYVTNNPVAFVDPFGLRNCTKTPLGVVCYPDSNPGTARFDPQIPDPPTPPGLPRMPKPVPMPSTFCAPATNCHDTITPGLPKPTYGDIIFDPCQGWDADSERLPFNGPAFSCSGNINHCLDAERRFTDACEKAGCVGRIYNGFYTGQVAAACCKKK